MEGALNGIKSIALSQQYSKETFSSKIHLNVLQNMALIYVKKILKDNPFLIQSSWVFII